MNITLKIDTRETKLIKLFNENYSNIKINIEQLDIGDIHIVNQYTNIVIERKTITDMLSSIKDGRYKEQKKRMMDNYDDILYIIENDCVLSTDNKLSSAYINTMIRDKIPIIFSSCINETLNIIIKIYNKLYEIPDRFKKSDSQFIDCIKTKTKKIENIDKKTCFILQLSQIPNINVKIAKIIAENHSSMKEFILTLNDWENPIEYLEALPGIGTNKAKKIIEFLL
jgi:ERCC4-type nuclease